MGDPLGRAELLDQEVVPQPGLVGVAAFALYLSLWPLGLLAMGIMFAAIPAAVARGAGEMERPVVSSLAWSALIAGAAIGGAVVGF